MSEVSGVDQSGDHSPSASSQPGVGFAEPGAGEEIVHSCTIFLCCLDGEIFDTYRNPNMNNKDQRVG